MGVQVWQGLVQGNTGGTHASANPCALEAMHRGGIQRCLVLGLSTILALAVQHPLLHRQEQLVEYALGHFLQCFEDTQGFAKLCIPL
jgi:hypothetical protein